MRQQPQYPATPIQENLAIGFFIADLLSLPLLPLFRRRIGLRIVSGKMFSAMLVLIGLGVGFREDPFSAEEPDGKVAYPYATLLRPELPSRPGFLSLVAIVSCVLAAREAGARWRELRRGIPWHTYHRGISRFDCRCFRPGTAERRIEPLVAILLGFAAWYGVSTALGGWLIFAGLALRTVEQRLYVINLRRNLDTMDATIDSQTLDEIAQQFQPQQTSRAVSDDQVEVIHAKLSDDVEALIARRKKRPRP